jgi:hypothetical protein
MSDSAPVVGVSGAAQFAMELASLIGIGLIGWHLGNQGVLGAILAVALILLMGTVWGRFRTPGFVPTGREPTNPVSGRVRIAIELAVYLLGIFGIWWSGRETTAYIVIGVMVVTLLLSYQRLIALWNTRL